MKILFMLFVLTGGNLAAASLETLPKPLEPPDRESFRVLQLESAEIQAAIAVARADLAEAENQALQNSFRRNALGNQLRQKYSADGYGLNRALLWVKSQPAAALPSRAPTTRIESTTSRIIGQTTTKPAEGK